MHRGMKHLAPNKSTLHLFVSLLSHLTVFSEEKEEKKSLPFVEGSQKLGRTTQTAHVIAYGQNCCVKAATDTAEYVQLIATPETQTPEPCGSEHTRGIPMAGEVQDGAAGSPFS